MKNIMRELGIVKWYNDDKGFGFIETWTNIDVFAHVRQFVGFEMMVERDIVEFDIEDSPKGKVAKKIKLFHPPKCLSCDNPEVLDLNDQTFNCTTWTCELNPRVIKEEREKKIKLAIKEENRPINLAKVKEVGLKQLDRVKEMNKPDGCDFKGLDDIVSKMDACLSNIKSASSDGIGFYTDHFEDSVEATEIIGIRNEIIILKVESKNEVYSKAIKEADGIDFSDEMSYDELEIVKDSVRAIRDKALADTNSTPKYSFSIRPVKINDIYVILEDIESLLSDKKAQAVIDNKVKFDVLAEDVLDSLPEIEDILKMSLEELIDVRFVLKAKSSSMLDQALVYETYKESKFVAVADKKISVVSGLIGDIVEEWNKKLPINMVRALGVGYSDSKTMVRIIASRYYKENEIKYKEGYLRSTSFGALFGNMNSIYEFSINKENLKEANFVINTWAEITKEYNKMFKVIKAINPISGLKGHDISSDWIMTAIKSHQIDLIDPSDVEGGLIRIKAEDDKIQDLIEMNVKHLINEGVSSSTIIKLRKSGLLSLEDLRFSKRDVKGIFSIISKDENSSTNARLKADAIVNEKDSNSFSRISGIIRNSKDTDERIRDLIRKYYGDIGHYEIHLSHMPRRAHETEMREDYYKKLHLFNKNGERIFHSVDNN